MPDNKNKIVCPNELLELHDMLYVYMNEDQYIFNSDSEFMNKLPILSHCWVCITEENKITQRLPDLPIENLLNVFEQIINTTKKAKVLLDKN